jgi:4-hydroxyphenylpyruvate dioxygenase
MSELFDNPIGLDGFEFVEFSAPEKGLLEPVFEAMGFSQVARHRSKDVELWRQGEINFITNYEPRSPAWYFSREHGPAACGMGFRVRDARAAYAELLARAAEPVQVETGPMELRLPAIRGIGGSIIYLIDRYEVDGNGALSIYDIDFDYLPGVERHPAGAGLSRIDHLTHNVYGGRMAHWADYYQKLFNFREIRYFDIKGEYTGLTSKALTAPDGKIRIPLNEEGGEGKKGQIEEFLRQFNGEGIQHIALICDDLVRTWDRLRQAGVPLMSAPPGSYYDMLDERLPGHGQPVEALKSRGILLDGSTEGGTRRLLLQIFAEPAVGPVFFEFIERQGDEGFGEGNFKALFESLERDQVRRGVLAVGEPAK